VYCGYFNNPNRRRKGDERSQSTNDVDNNRVDKLKDVDASVMLGGFFGSEYAN
jgi:hypothetical protein